MRRRWMAFFALLKEAVLKWNADNCLRLAASLSYYTLFSFFPLILVTLAIVQLLLNNSDSARAAILDALSRVTGGFHDEFVQTLAAAQATRRTTGVIGVAVLLVGASWVFGELVSAFNIIWGLQPPARGGPLQFLRSTVFSFALVLAAAFLLLVSMVVDAVLTALGNFMVALPGGPLLWTVLHALFSMLVLTLLFALLLKYLPRTNVAWSDVWIGAALTAGLWLMLQSAIAFYIALSSYKDYGAVGAILALIAWVYLSSQVLFLGGEFSNCYARRYGSRSVPQPTGG
jgi:membrane protein